MLQTDLLTDARKVLEALEEIQRRADSQEPVYETAHTAIAAQRRLVAALEKQEPVAWMWLEGTELLNGTEVEQFERVELSREKPSDDAYGLTPLYAHPPLGVSVPPTTHQMIEATAVLIEEHGREEWAYYLRLCKLEIPDVPTSGAWPSRMPEIDCTIHGKLESADGNCPRCKICKQCGQNVGDGDVDGCRDPDCPEAK